MMRMIETGVSGVEFIAINTDLQALDRFDGIAASLNIGNLSFFPPALPVTAQTHFKLS